MKFRIAEDGEKREPVIEIVLRRDDLDIDVVAINDAGEEQHLVSFRESGKLFRYGIDKNLGFDLDKNGRIKTQ